MDRRTALCALAGSAASCVLTALVSGATVRRASLSLTTAEAAEDIVAAGRSIPGAESAVALCRQLAGACRVHGGVSPAFLQATLDACDRASCRVSCRTFRQSVVPFRVAAAQLLERLAS